MSTRGFPDVPDPNRLDRSVWREFAKYGEFPRGLPCPYCGHALEWPDIREIPDPKTAEAMRQADRSNRKTKVRRALFTRLAVYTCGSCNGTMHGLARIHWSDLEYEPPDGDGGGTVEESRVLWLEPPPPLLALPAETPNSVAQATLGAFALVLHPSSCANRIRYAVELVADHFKIPRSSRARKKNPKPGGKKVESRRLALHARVKKLAERRTVQPGKAELLMAAKWLGNDGSHGEISIDDALDLIEIFVLALRRIFGTREPQIERRARDINRRKAKK